MRQRSAKGGRRARRLARLALAVLLGSLLLPACGNEEPVLMVRTDDPSGPTAAGSFGLVTLTQTQLPGADGPCLKLTGQFVHYTQLRAEEVIRAIDPEIGRLPNEGVLGQCSLLHRDERSAGGPAEEQGGAPSPRQPFAIDLLDAGTLQVHGPERTVFIEPRAFPDLIPAVGGVVYGSTPDSCLPLQGDGDLLLQTTGGQEVGAFSVQLPQPLRPVILSIDGLPLEEGRVQLARPLGEPLLVRWEGGEADPENVLHLEAELGGERLLCLAPDSGSFLLPTAALAEVPHDEPLRLRVRRIRVQPFVAPGIREGEMVTIVEDQVTLDDGDVQRR